MPIMPDGTFQGIDEVKGNLAFCEHVAGFIRGLDWDGYPPPRMLELDAEAAELRAIVEAYERKVSE